jgi:hypothetical protein
MKRRGFLGSLAALLGVRAEVPAGGSGIASLAVPLDAGAQFKAAWDAQAHGAGDRLVGAGGGGQGDAIVDLRGVFKEHWRDGVRFTTIPTAALSGQVRITIWGGSANGGSGGVRIEGLPGGGGGSGRPRKT